MKEEVADVYSSVFEMLGVVEEEKTVCENWQLNLFKCWRSEWGSQIRGVKKALYLGKRDHTRKVAVVGSIRDVGKFSFANRTSRGLESRMVCHSLVDIPKWGNFRTAVTSFTVSQSDWSAVSTI